MIEIVNWPSTNPQKIGMRAWSRCEILDLAAGAPIAVYGCPALAGEAHQADEAIGIPPNIIVPALSMGGDFASSQGVKL